MSRQRLRPALGEGSHITCPRCNGTGHHPRHRVAPALQILRMIQEEAMKDNTAAVHVQVPVEVAAFLLNEKRTDITKIELKQRVTVLLVPNKHLETPHYKLERLRHDDPRLENLQASYTMIEEPQEEVGITRRGAEKKNKQEPVIKGLMPEQPAPMPTAPAPKAAEPVAAAPAAPVAAPAPVAAGGGFFGMLKRLFGGAPAPAPEPAAKAAEPVKKERSERGERGRGERDRNGRGGDRNRRGERGERGERAERGDRGDRGEQKARDGKPRGEGKPQQEGRGERPERGERGDRAERGERSERGERGGDRNRRGERGDKPEQLVDGAPRQDRGERGERAERGERQERGERGDRGERGEGRRRREERPADVTQELAPLAGTEAANTESPIAFADTQPLDAPMDAPAGESGEERQGRRRRRRGNRGERGAEGAEQVEGSLVEGQAPQGETSFSDGAESAAAPVVEGEAGAEGVEGAEGAEGEARGEGRRRGRGRDRYRRDRREGEGAPAEGGEGAPA